MFKRSVLTLFVLMSLMASAQQDKYEKVSKGGQQYYQYTVMPKEGFYSIERKFGVDKASIIAQNPELAEGLKVGQTILVPVKGEVTTSKAVATRSRSAKSHTVASGETTYSLAKQYGITQEQLIQANPDLREGLKAGQAITIPQTSSATSAAVKTSGLSARPKTAKSAPSRVSESQGKPTHIVKQGDTYYAISKQYGVTVSQLRRANPSLGDSLPLGATIYLPSSTSNSAKDGQKDFTIHKIKPGDTVYGITKKYGVSARDLYEANPGLKSTELKVGEGLKVPSVKGKLEKETDEKTTSSLPAQVVHTVEQTETLYGIAKYYRLTQQQIIEANPTQSLSNLKTGMRINIPVTDGNKDVVSMDTKYSYYTLPKKMSLKRLAKKIGTPQQILQKLNPEYSRGKIAKGTLVKIPSRRTSEVKEQYQEFEEEKAKKEMEEEVERIEHELDPMYSKREGPIKIGIAFPFFLEKNNKRYKIYERSRPYVEFLAGAKLAAKEANKQGVKVELYAYDSGTSAEQLRSVLSNNPEIDSLDVLIGGMNEGQYTELVNHSDKNKQVVLLPFRVPENIVDGHPYTMRADISIPVKEQGIEEFVDKAMGQENVVVLRGSKGGNKGSNKLIHQVKGGVDQHNQEQGGGRIRYKELTFQDLRSSSTSLSKEGNLIFVSLDSSLNVGAEELEQIQRLKKRGYPVEIYGDPSLQVHNSMGLLYEVRFKTQVIQHIDYDGDAYKTFRKNYVKEYHNEAEHRHFNLAVYGYDIGKLFIKTIQDGGKSYANVLDTLSYSGVGTRFNFLRKNYWSGFQNQSYKLIEYGEDYMIHEIK